MLGGSRISHGFSGLRNKGRWLVVTAYSAARYRYQIVAEVFLLLGAWNRAQYLQLLGKQATMY